MSMYPQYVSRAMSHRYHRRFVNDLHVTLLFGGVPLNNDVALRMRDPNRGDVLLRCETDLGPWCVKITPGAQRSQRRFFPPDMISRFDEPVRAWEALNQRASVNKHSGKWNMQIDSDERCDWLHEIIRSFHPRLLTALDMYSDKVFQNG